MEEGVARCAAPYSQMLQTQHHLDRSGLRLLNPVTGVRTRVSYEADGTFVIHAEQEVDDLLRHNAHVANEWRPGELIGNTQRHRQHVAEIPAVLYAQLLHELGKPEENPAGWRAWLNNSDNRAWRTSGGRL